MKLRDDEVAEFDAEPWLRFELDDTAGGIEINDRLSGRHISRLSFSGVMSKVSMPAELVVQRRGPFDARAIRRATRVTRASNRTARITPRRHSRPATDVTFALPASRQIARAISAPKGKTK